MAGKESTDLSAGVKFERETEAHKEQLAEVAEGTLLAQACSPEDVADAVMSFIVFNRECDFCLRLEPAVAPLTAYGTGFVTGEILSVTGGDK